jgi:hypothetical protein
MSLLHDRPTVSDVPPPDTDVLIEEARRRHRRRRRTVSAFTAAAALGVLLTAVAGGFGGARHHGPSLAGGPAGRPSLAEVRSVDVRTVTLTEIVGSSNEGLGVEHDHLVVYGENGATSCIQAEIEPGTLRPSASDSFDCDEWPPGHDSYVVQQSIPDSESNNVALRLEHVGSGPARPTMGRVLMTTATASNTHYETTYGDGSLWVYACDTPNGGELVRVSDASGKVQSHIAMQRGHRSGR